MRFGFRGRGAVRRELRDELRRIEFREQLPLGHAVAFVDQHGRDRS